jgi:ubiquinone/menaquinone biosynthesis C-methylase UbiE
MQQYTNCINPSSHAMYSTYAQYYDRFYTIKKYDLETVYIHELLSKHGALTILDLGCGTGTHLAGLEQFGYTCVGVDINQEMLELAQSKVKSRVVQANMHNFDLNEKFDAIISMFAVFNHNLTDEDALATLQNIKRHLNKNGMLILDLYNPQSSGEKTECYGDIMRTMKWELDRSTNICLSNVSFTSSNLTHDSLFPLKIYSMEYIEKLLKQCGYTYIHFYDNYTLKPGTPSSKNLIVIAYN